MAAAEQQRRGQTATHADVATAGKRGSHLSAAADDCACTAATAADAILVPATSATTTAIGKLWQCVPAGQPNGNMWRRCISSCPENIMGPHF